MNQLYPSFVLILLATSVVVTIACACIGRTKFRAQRQRLAKLCRGLGIAVAGVAVLGAASGLILGVGAAAAPGLSAADRTRILSNGFAEAFYNILVGVLVAVPALLVARAHLSSQSERGNIRAEVGDAD